MPRLTSFKTTTFLLLVWIALSTPAHAQKKSIEFWEVPPQKGHVSDYSELLLPETITTLENMLNNYEDSTRHQVAVLIVYDLSTMPENYARKVMSEWKLGHNDHDGVLLLIVEKKREVRIEVGQGLIDKLKPELCRYIISEEIVPPFKEKEYNEGTIAGVNAILSGIHGAYPPKSIFNVEMFMWIASGVVVIASLIGIFSRYYSAAFFGGLLPFFVMTVGITFSLWWVAVYIIVLPLLRLVIVKTGMKQLTFGKNASGGSRSEDLHDRMARRNAMLDSSSSDSSSRSSSGSSSDSSGGGGRW